ncbi:MAG TPA: antibiotic biosynthesis monooxygenase family protein [Longimicrobiales bacterium]|nr:antibiotic biosynthesis monooxygenase family protein [Longimicrobiales bacterium]
MHNPPAAEFIAIWEYEVRPEQASSFVAAYGAGGPWIQLFSRSEGYLGTTLLRDPAGSARFVTIDRWASVAAFDRFQEEYRAEYVALDEVCGRFTVREHRIGHFSVVGCSARAKPDGG